MSGRVLSSFCLLTDISGLSRRSRNQAIKNCRFSYPWRSRQSGPLPHYGLPQFLYASSGSPTEANDRIDWSIDFFQPLHHTFFVQIRFINTENNICIYTYDDGKPIAVTFILGDDGTVSANGIIILNDDFQHDSVEEIEEAFADFQAEVTQIK